jgi:hypothetical protein
MTHSRSDEGDAARVAAAVEVPTSGLHRAFPLPRSGRFDDVMKPAGDGDDDDPAIPGPAAGNGGRY